MKLNNFAFDFGASIAERTKTSDKWTQSRSKRFFSREKGKVLRLKCSFLHCRFIITRAFHSLNVFQFETLTRLQTPKKKVHTSFSRNRLMKLMMFLLLLFGGCASKSWTFLMEHETLSHRQQEKKESLFSSRFTFPKKQKKTHHHRRCNDFNVSVGAFNYLFYIMSYHLLTFCQCYEESQSNLCKISLRWEEGVWECLLRPSLRCSQGFSLKCLIEIVANYPINHFSCCFFVTVHQKWP